ncbi:putative amidohydrolase [Herbihabitans rhizosphaerae]|uniref:Putative amidohydrolase n=1 Tax=Herbihabitans rhizosphaerae TaxID=1872711 RepID=A0A4V2ESX4_9PSEU|nr:carbon-nitrogen hydrolase family protein [Herbihabitans rhizosphaerae]RZS39083.1 putative amidohydrolase [Herbihabitans rhizosphaerae]
MSREDARGLTVAVGQPVCVAGDVAANAAAHADLVRRAGARVVVCPELSLTGYELDGPTVAVADPRLDVLADACTDTGTIALAGAPVWENGREHIAMLRVDRDGVAVVYLKMLLDPAEARFAPGEKPAVIEVDGWRFGLGICRDSAFDDHLLPTVALGIDCYAVGAVFAASSADRRDTRMHGISVRHNVFVALASFAGPTGGGFAETSGGSGVWSPQGTVVDQAGAEPGEFATATLTR